MFQVIRSDNRLVPLQERRFADLKLREREHLQEWLAQTPEALGEELLIIQKEFDGFAETRERLDLLALDKEGRLVVVENKLDDSGRDVVWQALKYAAYCSTLVQTDVLAIYRKHLEGSGQGGDAETNLRDFLDVEDLDEIILNPRNEQRLVLVAANFRKEVTAAVLWLLGHGIRAQCFRAVPFSFNEEVFIDLRQIIPTPEASDFMIRMTAKDSEQKSIGSARQRRHELRHAFFTQAMDVLREHQPKFANVTPSGRHYLHVGTGVSGCRYTVIFQQSEARVSLGLERSDASENKWILDKLKQERAEIEDRFGDSLEWRRMEDKKACGIVYRRGIDGFDESSWPDIAAWLGEHVARLEEAFAEPLTRLNRELKSGLASEGDYLTQEESTRGSVEFADDPLR